MYVNKQHCYQTNNLVGKQTILLSENKLAFHALEPCVYCLRVLTASQGSCWSRRWLQRAVGCSVEFVVFEIRLGSALAGLVKALKKGAAARWRQ